MLCCAVLCCAVLCCAVLCCAVLCCAVLCCAVLCCAVLCCAVLCCAVLCCAVLCCAVLCCVVLCCVVYCLFYCDTVQCVHTFYITVREMPCMGRRYCPVHIFPLWAIVACTHLYCGSNKVVKTKTHESPDVKESRNAAKFNSRGRNKPVPIRN